MSRVVHFEIHVDDPERSIKFYNACFGWAINKWEGPFDYWLITTGPREELGIDGGMLKRTTPIDDSQAVIAYVGIIGVEDLDAIIDKVENNGGAITQEKAAVPGVGWLAYFKDTEGNQFGAMQPDMSAK